MADEQEKEFVGLSFETANPVQSINQASRQDSPAGAVSRSGLTPLNTAATGIIDGLADKEGLDRDHYSVLLGANTAAGVISCHAVRPDTPKAMTFRRNVDDRTITLYLHGVFKDFPTLRPEGRRACRITPTTDANGRPCAIINLRGGLAKVTTKRGSGPTGGSAPGDATK
jgi:hypothetical protein